MCLDERCRHPYTCNCLEQCGGPPAASIPCPECGAGMWEEEGFVCYVCTEEAIDRLIQHLQGGMIPSDYAYGMAKDVAHRAAQLKPEAVSWA